MPSRLGVALLVLVTACGVDLPLRDDVTYTCNATADCPLDLSCAVGVHRCVAQLDTDAPHLTSITATDRETVVLVFDEAVNREAAALPGSFSIVRDDGQELVVVAAAALVDAKSIVLRTGRQRGAAIYTLSTSITDAQGNAAILDSDAFIGFGAAPDTLPPEVTTPTPASVIVVAESQRGSPTVTLGWNPRAGAIGYTVDISKKEDFSVVDATVDVSGDEASYVLAVEEGFTYFWRVRSDATTAGTFGGGSFTVLFDTIYVFCPPTAAACRSGDGIGSKNVPLASVSRGVTLAADRNLLNVAIASRGGAAGYHEPIAITGGARNLRGGYTGDFTGSVDIAIDPTRVVYEANVLQVIQNTGPIGIDKLTLSAVIDPLAPTQALSAAALATLGADVTFTSTVIETEELGATSTPELVLPYDSVALTVAQGTAAKAIVGQGSRLSAGSAFHTATGVIAFGANLVIDGAAIRAGRTYSVDADQGSTAVLSIQASVDITGAQVVAGKGGATLVQSTSVVRNSSFVISDGSGSTAAVGVTFGSLTFENNAVIVASTSSNGSGIEIFGATRMVNNTIIVGGTASAVGVYIDKGTPLIVNNTIVVSGNAPVVEAIHIRGGGNPDIANTLITCLAGTGTSRGIVEESLGSDPLALVGNVISGCDAGYVDETGSTVADPDTIAGQTVNCEPSCGTLGTTQAFANTVMAAVDPYVSLNGADGLLDTPDNDLHLATIDPTIGSGGIDTSTTVCGSNQSPHTCGSLTTDRAGVPRTLPLSVGAYEKD